VVHDGPKIKLQTIVHNSPNSDGFYIFQISQGSVATQSRCVGMFSNHVYRFSTECASEKNFDNRSIFDKDMDKTLWLTFLGHPLNIWRYVSFNIRV